MTLSKALAAYGAALIAYYAARSAYYEALDARDEARAILNTALAANRNLHAEPAHPSHAEPIPGIPDGRKEVPY